jgi:transcription-repair coupling factor (superfamily II helicase)
LTLPDSFLSQPGRITLAGTPEGSDALALAELARAHAHQDFLFVARDDGRLARMVEALAFFAPDLTILDFPAWDCVPYDRVSPHVDVVARRVDTLARLAERSAGAPGVVVLTNVAALAQRVPPRETLSRASLTARAGARVPLGKLISFLEHTGYVRSDTVMEAGEYAVRGGIVDLFPPGSPEPLRLDFFGDEIEAVRAFDPMSQRTTGPVDGFVCRPVSEVTLDEGSIARFRAGYRELFGVVQGADPLYESISAGVKFTGMEHWLPLFHDGLDTLFAYLPDAVAVLDPQTDQALAARQELVLEYYDARRTIESSGQVESGMVYHPLPPPLLYLETEEWTRHLAARPVLLLSPFDSVEAESSAAIDMKGRIGLDFGEIRTRPGTNLYDGVRERIDAEIKGGRRVVIAAWTHGSRDRLGAVLKDRGLKTVESVESWAEALALGPKRVAALVLGLDHGFVTPDLALITEQDILGDRLARPARKKKKGAQFIAEASALSEGDLVVHVEHGIGRYDGLVALQVAGAPHDCLRVIYDGGDKLFVPVENIEVLTRFGSDQSGVALDKLGGTAWQARKARLKKRIRDIADQLIQVAALRQLRQSESLVPAEGLYDEFCARFPWVETEDQLRAIEETVADMGSGRPMDRLICGDVGFGKTEVALRAAFVAALQGLQVAVVVPTTLLARQHYRTFRERFQGLPVRIEQLSRLVTAKQASETKAGLAQGTVDIVVGTHALLAKSIGFKRLGLLIIDEEQHFGVAHKERLKQLKADVHVLTLSATPIPRTLQLALSGVKEMSVIATPPVDRLAVRTFILPYDPVVLREAIMRERYRGGQVFYVCPRLADIDHVADRLAKLVPEVKTAVAHGRLSPSELEEVMVAFGDRQYDVLLSTNIVESGLDMPSVNTLIIHRADMFGLGQLYQLRGRVGRGKVRGYAYFTLPNDKVLSKAAEKRLQVMQTLDSLGAGFQLASHDLDIRGAGNLLGDEQSGHIREVGIELYQQMLEEAVAAAKGGLASDAAEEWSPQITLGSPVLIPETYVADLSVRLSLYRRIGQLDEQGDLDALAAELIDRFGKLPPEVENLLEVVAIKALCKQAGIEKVDSGPKGAVVTLRGNLFANPAGLVQYVSRAAGSCKIRPDHKLVFLRDWDDPAKRVKGLRSVIAKLAELARA